MANQIENKKKFRSRTGGWQTQPPIVKSRCAGIRQGYA